MIWKPIPHAPHYEASDSGYIRSIDRQSGPRFYAGQVLNPSTDSEGNQLVTIARGDRRRTFKVHRLIYETFHNHLPRQVKHLNGNKADNSLANLYDPIPTNNPDHDSVPLWVFPSREDNNKLIVEMERTGFSYEAIAEAANLSESRVRQICAQARDESPRYRITRSDAESIRLLRSSGTSLKVLAARYNVSRSYISAITTGKRK